MPVTPFHFGPGAALYGLAPRHVSFLAFCTTNVLIDFESLYNLTTDAYPVHRFFHTYVGASLMIVVTVLLFLVLRRWAQWLPDILEWKALVVTQVLIGAAAGAYSHVLLDSIMHADMAPLAPFSSGNILLHAMSVEELHWLCIILGTIGVMFSLRRGLHVVRTRRNDNGR